jgi:hypothetical protein
MRNPTNGSRTSVKLAFSLGLLAVALGGPALAGDGKDASRGAKHALVTGVPGQTLPVSPRTGLVEKGPAASLGIPGLPGAWKDAVRRLVLAVHGGIGF